MGSFYRRKVFGISFVLVLAVGAVVSASAFAVAYFIERVEVRGAVTETISQVEPAQVLITAILNRETLHILCKRPRFNLTIERNGESRGSVVFETEALNRRECEAATVNPTTHLLEPLPNCRVRTPFTWTVRGQLVMGAVEAEQELRIERAFNVELEGARCELPAGRVISGVAYPVEGSVQCALVVASAEQEGHTLNCTPCNSRVRFNRTPATITISSERIVLNRRERWSAR